MENRTEVIDASRRIGGAPSVPQALVLRVMRLTTPLPSLRPSVPIVTAIEAAEGPVAGQSDSFLRAAPIWEGEGASCGVGVTTVLPSSFGSIFASETFRSFITVFNRGPYTAEKVSVSIEMQTPSQRRIQLLDTREDPVKKLEPRNSANHIVKVALPDLGVHVLKCAATYIDGSRQSRTFRQYYRFNVLAPLEPSVTVFPFKDVLQEGHLMENNPKGLRQFLVDLRILNAMPVPVYILSVELIAGPKYAVQVLNQNSDDANANIAEEKRRESKDDYPEICRRATLGVGDTRSYLFYASRELDDTDTFEAMSSRNVLSEAQPLDKASSSHSSSSLKNHDKVTHTVNVVNKKSKHAVNLSLPSTDRDGSSQGSSMHGSTRRRREIGHLSISWKSALGETGRINNWVVAYEPRRKRAEVELNIIAVPQNIKSQHPFSARCVIRNNAARPLRLYVQVRRDLVGEIVPLGVSGASLGEVLPGTSCECDLVLLPLRSGQHAISGVRVVDIDSKKSYNSETPIVSVS